INLGDGSDQATVTQTGSAQLTVNGKGLGDILNVDLSATTAAIAKGAAEIKDGGVNGEGIVSGLTTTEVDFNTLSRANILLGSGNDFFSIDTSNAILPSTIVDIEGGGGDDFIEATSVSK